MEFRILGPLEARVGDELIDLGPHKQRALLALLLIYVDRVVPTDRILDALWGDDAAGKEKALWVHISRLRSALEPHRAERGEKQTIVVWKSPRCRWTGRSPLARAASTASSRPHSSPRSA